MGLFGVAAHDRKRELTSLHLPVQLLDRHVIEEVAPHILQRDDGLAVVLSHEKERRVDRHAPLLFLKWARKQVHPKGARLFRFDGERTANRDAEFPVQLSNRFVRHGRMSESAKPEWLCRVIGQLRAVYPPFVHCPVGAIPKPILYCARCGLPGAPRLFEKPRRSGLIARSTSHWLCRGIGHKRQTKYPPYVCRPGERAPKWFSYCTRCGATGLRFWVPGSFEIVREKLQRRSSALSVWFRGEKCSDCRRLRVRFGFPRGDHSRCDVLPF